MFNDGNHLEPPGGLLAKSNSYFFNLNQMCQAILRMAQANKNLCTYELGSSLDINLRDFASAAFTLGFDNVGRWDVIPYNFNRRVASRNFREEHHQQMTHV